MSAPDRAGVALGTFFGAGYFPWGPGTFASALTLLLCAALGPAGRGLIALIIAAVLYLPACWAAGVCERCFDERDPSRVVIDEVVGQMIVLGAVSMPLVSGGWKYWLAGFILFRVLDIVKPYPIRRLEHLPGGFGVITDDVLAGVYGYAILRAAMHLGF